MDLSNKFQTKISVNIENSVDLPERFVFESKTSEAEIEYEISVSIQRWGISGLKFNLLNESIAASFEISNEEGETVDVDFEIEINEAIVDSSDLSIKGDICPKELNLSLTHIVKRDDKFFATANAVLVF